MVAWFNSTPHCGSWNQWWMLKFVLMRILCWCWLVTWPSSWLQSFISWHSVTCPRLLLPGNTSNQCSSVSSSPSSGVGLSLDRMTPRSDGSVHLCSETISGPNVWYWWWLCWSVGTVIHRSVRDISSVGSNLKVTFRVIIDHPDTNSGLNKAQNNNSNNNSAGVNDGVRADLFPSLIWVVVIRAEIEEDAWWWWSVSGEYQVSIRSESGPLINLISL